MGVSTENDAVANKENPERTNQMKTIKRYFFTGVLKGLTVDHQVPYDRRLGLFRSVTNTWYFDYDNEPKIPRFITIQEKEEMDADFEEFLSRVLDKSRIKTPT